MHEKYAFAALLAALSSAIPVGAAAMPPADGWEIGPTIRGRNYSVGMPRLPDASRDGGVEFEFPRNGGEVDALVTAIRPLSGAREVAMRYRIDAAPNTRFVSAETPEQTATISVYFQQAGDNWSGRGRYGSYRWYAPTQAVVPLSPGVHTINIRLDEPWTNVNGVSSSQDPAGFAAALANSARFAVAFGTSSRRSHGVYATGPARFTLLDLDIR